MSSEYAVMAETHEGSVMTLRRGFLSRDDAEDHPVQLSAWRRVWVEIIGPAPKPKEPPTLPPLPWDWIAADHPTANARYHVYLVDATGRKIAAIWGKDGEKELTADHILKSVNALTAEQGST